MIQFLSYAVPIALVVFAATLHVACRMLKVPAANAGLLLLVSLIVIAFIVVVNFAHPQFMLRTGGGLIIPALFAAWIYSQTIDGVSFANGGAIFLAQAFALALIGVIIFFVMVVREGSSHFLY